MRLLRRPILHGLSDPAGRFTQRDPIGLAGGLNRYAYVGNNPVNYNDPDGLAAKIAGNWLDTQTHGYFSDFVDVGRDTLSLPGVQTTLYGGAAMAAGGGVGSSLLSNPVTRAVAGAAATVLDLQNTADGVPVGTGSLAKNGLQVTEKGLARIEAHLSQFGDIPENTVMINRLRSSELTKVDQNFYLHELKESSIMKRGIDYNSAHRATLEWQSIEYKRGYEAQLYHPDAMKAAEGGLSSWSDEALKGAGLK
jgi:uncharacterized protein RhaS with RHS repeats